jgi:hypothetical protein
MDLYSKRCIDFFIHSITYLKSQSGGQRWNAICEDAVELFFEQFPKGLNNPFTRESLWRFLFDPPNEPNDELYSTFVSLCVHQSFLDFFFLILQSLLDPPSYPVTSALIRSYKAKGM